MSAKMAEISARRAVLIAKAAVQRERLSWHYHQFDRPAALVEKSLAVVRFLRSPVVATGLTYLLLRTRWRRFGFLTRLFGKGWRVFLTVSRFLK